jgi:hypothetical protein
MFLYICTIVLSCFINSWQGTACFQEKQNVLDQNDVVLVDSSYPLQMNSW